jgi:hypothetical protein
MKTSIGGTKMGKLKFQKLTPTQDVDLSGYEDAFQYIFAEDDIKNIAISGAYSSGKSSVFESYIKKHPEKKFMHISLAHFKAMEDLTDNTFNVPKRDKNHNDSENVIEGKILNQLIQQIPPEKITQTKFQVKRNLGGGFTGTGGGNFKVGAKGNVKIHQQNTKKGSYTKGSSRDFKKRL